MQSIKPSQRCYGFIKNKEKFMASPYQKKGDKPTIGYGTTVYPNGVKVQLTDNKITEEQAIVYLNSHIDKDIPQILKLVTISLRQNEFDAIVSLVYNIGVTNFATSALLKFINASLENITPIRNEWNKWVWDSDGKGGKEIKPGLVTRRREEFIMFSE